MKKIGALLLTLMVVATTVPSQAQLWQGKGRIAISSDGNEHDHDDWAATPMSLALLAAKGVQDKLTLYTYSDHIWGSNMTRPNSYGMSAYEHMRESALGGKKWFGFDNTNFVCAVDNAEAAYRAMTAEINASSEENPLLIIGAGPMQVIGESLLRADQSKLKYVTVLTHSWWNDNHSDKPYEWWDSHSGWTFKEMEESFTKYGTTFVTIKDQNGGENYEGMNAPKAEFDWIKTSPARNNPAYKEGSWDWLYSRIITGVQEKGMNYDPSDAGMIIYIFTGIEETDPLHAKEILENPVR